MQTAQKTRDSMVQFWEGVDMLVGVQRQGYGSDSAENCGFRRCSALTRLDVPVIMQRRSLAVGGAADSADIPVATETDALSVRVTAMNWVFVHFGHFSRSSGLRS